MKLAARFWAKVKRELAIQRNPLNALLYDPVLDGPKRSVQELAEDKEEEAYLLATTYAVGTFPCRSPICKGKQREFRRVNEDAAVEAGVTYCTGCGWGHDEGGVFSRFAGPHYGERV